MSGNTAHAVLYGPTEPTNLEDRAMDYHEYDPNRDVMLQIEEEDFSWRAICRRHPRIVTGFAIAMAMVVAFPVIDWAWKTLLGLH